jgi:hypothetical protein
MEEFMSQIIVVTEHCPLDRSTFPPDWITACSDQPEQIAEHLLSTNEPVILISLMFSPYSYAYKSLERIAKQRPGVSITPAVRAHPLLAEAVADQVRLISKDPAHECLVLVAAGPEKPEDNREWLSDMEHLVLEVQNLTGLGLVKISSLMVDAPQEVHQEALHKLRTLIPREAQRFRILVVPLEFTPVGIEEELNIWLGDLPATLLTKALMPHPALIKWVQLSATEALA